MQSKEIKDKNLNVPDELKNIYKVLNKLEQRIATLEKVLESHAKCIGEMRGEEIQLNQEYRKKIVKRMGELHEQS